MNKKTVISILLVVVIVVCGGAVFALTKGNTNKEYPLPSTTESQSGEASTQSQSSPVDAETTEAVTSETESESSTEAQPADYSYLKNDGWYFFDETKREGYAFEFIDEDDVKITYFNTDNIDGEDGKTVSGRADYEIVDGKLIISDVPKTLEKDEGFVFSVTKDGIAATDGAPLEKSDKVSLDYAYKHFHK